MMMALRSTLNTATSFLEMSEYLLKSLITENDHGNPGFHHAKERGWHICGDLCLILQSPKHTVFTTVYLQEPPESFWSFKLNSGARNNVHGPQVFC